MRKAGGLEEQRVAPRRQPARRWGPQSYGCKELDSVSNLKELGSRFFSFASKNEYSPASTLISALSDPEQRSQLGLLPYGAMS